VWFAEAAGSFEITLLEKGVMSRVPKLRAGTRDGEEKDFIQQLLNSCCIRKIGSGVQYKMRSMEEKIMVYERKSDKR
jgi:hypothetical protein